MERDVKVASVLPAPVSLVVSDDHHQHCSTLFNNNKIANEKEKKEKKKKEKSSHVININNINKKKELWHWKSGLWFFVMVFCVVKTVGHCGVMIKMLLWTFWQLLRCISWVIMCDHFIFTETLVDHHTPLSCNSSSFFSFTCVRFLQQQQDHLNINFLK